MKTKTLLLLAILISLFACKKVPKESPKVKETTQVEFVVKKLRVEGMTCDHCEMAIQKSVAVLPGIEEVRADHTDSTVTVKFDNSQTDLKAIENAIARKGYQMVGVNP